MFALGDIGRHHGSCCTLHVLLRSLACYAVASPVMLSPIWICGVPTSTYKGDAGLRMGTCGQPRAVASDMPALFDADIFCQSLHKPSMSSRTICNTF
jgi:hypothetical protein